VGRADVGAEFELPASTGPGAAADPDHDDIALFDFGLKQEGRSHVRERPVEGDVERTGIVFHRLFDDQASAWRIHRGRLVGNRSGRTRLDPYLIPQSHKVEKLDCLIVALLHALGGATGTEVRRYDSSQVKRIG